jgi:hypothetical protein
MKLQSINAKNFRYLVGPYYSPRLLRKVDEVVTKALKHKKKWISATGEGAIFKDEHGNKLHSLEFVETFDGKILCGPGYMEDACGFVLPYTQIMVGAWGWSVGVPLNSIMKGSRPTEDRYVVYCHSIGSRTKDRIPKNYVGMTKQGMTKRYEQHLLAANSNSPYLFHQELRKYMQDGAAIHQILVAGLTKDEAENYEEKFVEELSLYPKGLNMVPGGKGGLAYLRSIGALTDTNRNQPRDRLIGDFLRACTREGKPNPLLSMRWKDDDFAASMIFSNPRNMTREQVMMARSLLEDGLSIEFVTESVGARNIKVIEALASGKTYSRVH